MATESLKTDFSTAPFFDWQRGLSLPPGFYVLTVTYLRNGRWGGHGFMLRSRKGCIAEPIATRAEAEEWKAHLEAEARHVIVQLLEDQ